MVHGFKKETTNYEQPTIYPDEGRANRKSKGFTLIELLVVIAIIGILASLATYSYTDSQKKSRDSRRKSDLTAIQKALELAKQDSPGNYSYPYCPLTNANYCQSAGPIPGITGTNTTPQLAPSSGTPYIKAVPTDPKTGNNYAYLPNGATNPCNSGTCTSFSLVACLENSKDPQLDPNAPGGSSFPQNTICSSASPVTYSYTITNL